MATQSMSGPSARRVDERCIAFEDGGGVDPGPGVEQHFQHLGVAHGGGFVQSGEDAAVVRGGVGVDACGDEFAGQFGIVHVVCQLHQRGVAATHLDGGVGAGGEQLVDGAAMRAGDGIVQRGAVAGVYGGDACARGEQSAHGDSLAFAGCGHEGGEAAAAVEVDGCAGGDELAYADGVAVGGGGHHLLPCGDAR